MGQAAEEVIHRRPRSVGGHGGLIALDAQGRVAMPMSTEGMYRGVMRAGGACSIDIFRG